ncbi:homeobox domain-containing protein [Fusarium pseudoanthophilum]|uniref:Homeobox domain-containing protein n=1 Tax=Fusarium pseudoanthophilum TaxID=48495 RepID=A0A8H5Q2R6_9HYPO|nr:homeobox domain-containing protein [Fusarium pseudoanthophilum]
MGMDPTETSGATSLELTTSTPSDATNAGTSDASSVESTTLESLKVFVNDLNVATRAILDDSTRRYTQVQALITCWPDELSDRKHILESARNLNEVFRSTYRFDIDENPYELSQSDPHLYFVSKLCQYLAPDKPGLKSPEQPEDPTKLFILYYGGHAMRRDGKLVWRPSQNAEDDMEVTWSYVVSCFKKFAGDLLFLFDCCHASEMFEEEHHFRNRCEILCATRGKRASGLKESSFTNALVHELSIEAETRGICEIKYLKTRLNLDAKKKEYNLVFDPYWDRLTPSGTRSICIAPLGKGGKKGSKRSSAELKERVEAVSEARVVFKARFEDPKEQRLIDEWKQFVHWRPKGINEILWYAVSQTEFQSVFKSNSSSAVISVPMIVWDSMPKRAAYEFISVSRSDNMLGSGPRHNIAAYRGDWKPSMTIETQSRITFASEESPHSASTKRVEDHGKRPVQSLGKSHVWEVASTTRKGDMDFLAIISLRTMPPNFQSLEQYIPDRSVAFETEQSSILHGSEQTNLDNTLNGRLPRQFEEQVDKLGGKIEQERFLKQGLISKVDPKPRKKRMNLFRRERSKRD